MRAMLSCQLGRRWLMEANRYHVNRSPTSWGVPEVPKPLMWHFWQRPTDPSMAGAPMLWQLSQVKGVRTGPSMAAMALRALSGAKEPSGMAWYIAMRLGDNSMDPATATKDGRL